MPPKKEALLPSEMVYARLKHPLTSQRPGRQSSTVEVAHDEQPSYESFVLGNGEKKIEVRIESHMPSSAVFTFNKEDHTLGNMITARLHQNPKVIFAGYKVPHPLIPKFELRVQTNGDITPKEALIAACHDLVKDLGILSREFTKEYELRKMVGAAQQQNGSP